MIADALHEAPTFPRLLDVRRAQAARASDRPTPDIGRADPPGIGRVALFTWPAEVWATLPESSRPADAIPIMGGQAWAAVRRY